LVTEDMVTDTVSPTLTDLRTRFVVEMIHQIIIARATHPLYPSPISGAVYSYFNSAIIPEHVSLKVPEELAVVMTGSEKPNVPLAHIQIVRAHSR